MLCFFIIAKKKYFFSNLFGVLSSVGDLLPLSTRVYFKTSWSYTRLPGDRSLAYSCTGKLIYVQYMNIYSIGKCNIYAAFIQISSNSTSFKNLNLNYYYYFNSIFFFVFYFLNNDYRDKIKNQIFYGMNSWYEWRYNINVIQIFINM